MDASDAPFGEWLLDDLSSTYYIERDGWAPARADRVAERLQHDRSASARLRVVVFFGKKETAFTVAGPYIFVSRRLLERCRTDAACAFIVAHEIAHHDLGHVAEMPEWMARYAKHRGAWVVAALAQRVVHRILGPEREAAADRHAVDLCLRAGYHPDDFLGGMGAVESLIRDIGSSEAIFGPEYALLQELEGRATLLNRVRVWQWERATGYFPFRERRRRVEAYLTELPLSELDLQREAVAEASDRRDDPGRLAPDQRGLFTSPPSSPPTATMQPTIAIGSHRWLAMTAPNEQVIFYDSEDDAHRMLARAAFQSGRTLAEIAKDAVASVHRHWWRGHDGKFYVVETDGGMAVIANLPEGPWRAAMTALTCLRLHDGGRQRALPWRNLGYATPEELEAMRSGEIVDVSESDVVVLPDSA